MLELIKKIYRKLSNSKLSPLINKFFDFLSIFEYNFLCLSCLIKGNKMPNKQEIELMKNNVTVIFKSFERQKKAKQLYKCIQRYYPGTKVIIADDSAKPLNIKGNNLEIIQLPFNSGISYGLNCALEKVNTPFLIRLDDDQMLTPATKFHNHLNFLFEHPEVDIVAVLYKDLLHRLDLKKMLDFYSSQTMSNAPKKLLIPHMTYIDKTHIVLAKPPQKIIARTDVMKKIGYDNNIRMLDHNEFFFRASGVAVSVVETTSFLYHRHNTFDKNYNKYRNDYEKDVEYIKQKSRRLIAEEKAKNTTDNT